MQSRGAGLPPFVKPIKPFGTSRSDAKILVAAACVAVVLTAAICFATAPASSTDDPTNFAAAVAIG